jgi:putative membrane protein
MPDARHTRCQQVSATLATIWLTLNTMPWPELVILFAAVLAGTLLGATIGLLPGVHIYAVAAALLLAVERGWLHVTQQQLAFLCVGLLSGWTMLAIAPSIYFYAPDDMSSPSVLPSTKLLLRGEGHQAVALIGSGALGALLGLLALVPLADSILRPLRQIVQPHVGWMVLAVIAFLVLGEWPRANEQLASPWRRLASAWAYLGAGQLTFWLSGALGMVLMYRSPVPLEASHQNLLPAFTGLFALPGLLQVILLGARPPRQPPRAIDLPIDRWLRGTIIGLAGGLFAGFLPVISGGIGALLAGHASAQREDRLFLVSQGASRMSYLAGGYLLLFLPGVTLTRGGLSALISTQYLPAGWGAYWTAVAALAFSGALAFVMLLVCSRWIAGRIERLPIKTICLAMLLVAMAITVAFTGAGGAAIMVVGCAIGLLPVLSGGRRLNALGVLLIPISLNMTGAGPTVAQFMGLLP